MNSENLLKETLREWAGEARVPHDLADRALGRRSRRRKAVFLAAATAVVTAAALVTVPAVLRGEPSRDDRVTSTATIDPVVSPAPAEPAETDVRTDTENSPPVRFIAAGRIAVSAYSIWHEEKIPGGRVRNSSTWYLYDPRTETYERTDWRALDVSPGLRYAAVLEGELPSRRIGVIDVATREVLRWIDLDQPVMEAVWSPDGTRLLTTAYDADPTVVIPQKQEGSFIQVESNRLGFHVVDVNTGRARFHPTPSADSLDRGHRFTWAADGTLIRVRQRRGGPTYYDLDGRTRPEPPEARLSARAWAEAGVSPDGRLFADGGRPPGPQTVVKDVATGEIMGVQPMLQLLAWADNEHLIALGCAGDCSNEFNNGLVLVSLDGKQTTQLSGNRKNSQQPGSWAPLLTRR